MRPCSFVPVDEPLRSVLAARRSIGVIWALIQVVDEGHADCRFFERNRRTDRVQKRQSNVMKLAEQNEKLKEELRAMTERLEAAERKQRDLEARAQQRRSGESTH